MSNKTAGNLLKATIGVSLFTIASKVFGFIREALVAAYYGSNSATDAYFLAQNMPKMLFPAICNSLSAAFLSIYVSKSVQESDLEGDKFASKALTVAALIAILLSAGGIIFAQWIVPVFAPGFDAETAQLATKLTQIVMVSFIMLMGQCMFAAILNARKLFVRVQLGSILLNVVIIAGIFIFGDTKDVAILTWTTVIGHTLQNILLFVFARKRFKFSMPRNVFDSDVKRMLRLALPILLGNSVYQINNIVDKNLASNLGEGAVSALSYSGTLNLLVVAVFITSLTTVLYPTLTRNAAEGKTDEYSSNLLNSISMIGIVIIPISIITFIFSDDIVRIVYERGEFDPEATRLTSAALKYYALGFVFTGVREMMIKGFYARENSKTPMINGIIAVGVNIVASVILSRYMGIAGIALGTAISGLLAAVLLLISMRRDLESVRISDKKKSLLSMLAAGIVCTGVLIGVDKLLISFSDMGTLGTLLRFVAAIVVGGGAYVAVLMLTKCEEVTMIAKYAKKMLSKFKGKKAE